MGRSRDPDRWRRQMAGLARNNPALAAKLDAGELPGFPGPLEGTEHLHPEAAAATPRAPEPPPAPPDPVPAAPPAPAPVSTRTPTSEVGSYQEPAPDATHPGLEPPADDDGPPTPEPPEPEPDPAPAGQRRGPLAQLADGFRGRV